MKLLIIDNEGIIIEDICKQFERIRGDKFDRNDIYFFQKSVESSNAEIVSLFNVQGGINDVSFKSFKEEVESATVQFVVENQDEPILILIDLVLNNKVRTDYPTIDYYKNDEYSVEIYANILKRRFDPELSDNKVYVVMYSASETGDSTISEVMRNMLLDDESAFPRQCCYIENISFFTRTQLPKISESSPITFDSDTIKWLKTL